MPGQCCSATNTQSQSRASLLARYARQSLLCGILGSLKFIIALASVIQTSIFLLLCKKGMHDQARDTLKANLYAAKRNLKLGILPSIEMFILMPAMFVGLHVFLNVGMIYCIAACWAFMFTVCFTVRVAGILTSCPSIESPMYKDGFPFPITQSSTGDSLAGSVEKTIKCMQSLDSPLSIAKAYALAFLFVPLRAITAAAQAALLVVELVSFPIALVSDVCVAICRSLANRISKSSPSQHDTKNFQYSKASLTFALSLAKTLMKDMFWVVTLGMSGVSSLRNSTKVRCDYYPPAKVPENQNEDKNPHTTAIKSNPTSDGRGCCSEKASATQQNIVPNATTVTNTATTEGTASPTLQNTTSVSCCCKSKALAS